MPQKTKNKKNAKTVNPERSVAKQKWPINWRHTLQGRIKTLLLRRPHRSFRMTNRRDYTRSLKLPGYWAFTNEVRKTLLGHKKLFLSLVVFYAVLSILLVGFASQQNYTQLSDMIREVGDELVNGDFSNLENAGLVLASIVNGTLTSNMTEAQGIYMALLGILVWLTAVWLLRATMAGQRPRLRDGLYNAGSPLLSTLFVAIILLLQLLPVVLAIIAYGSASATGFLKDGVEAMLFWAAAGALGLLSLYWISSTLFALVVVTLPGMYPWRAIQTAGDLVVGRRIRLLLRILWLLLMIAIVWMLVMLPLVLLDTWVKGMVPAIEWLPVVPVALLVMAALSVVWSSSYLYLLYRKVVDDDATPA